MMLEVVVMLEVGFFNLGLVINVEQCSNWGCVEIGGS